MKAPSPLGSLLLAAALAGPVLALPLEAQAGYTREQCASCAAWTERKRNRILMPIVGRRQLAAAQPRGAHRRRCCRRLRRWSARWR